MCHCLKPKGSQNQSALMDHRRATGNMVLACQLTAKWKAITMHCLRTVTRDHELIIEHQVIKGFVLNGLKPALGHEG